MLTQREFLEVSTSAVALALWPPRLSIDCVIAGDRSTSHRPWPLPRSRWVMFMRWHDLMFLHWPIRPEYIRPLIPAAWSSIFDGWCWVGIVPFHMSGVRPRIRSAAAVFTGAQRPNLCQNSRQKRRVVFQSRRSELDCGQSGAMAWLALLRCAHESGIARKFRYEQCPQP